ncbi:hypothetical protein [Natronorubrum thiooxidans]|uniref:Uncharacterized protein n=1 Tax=Natronorubrum thiooxidans TaxID=308853 RepID=A0A1N7GZN2_9EURY|nr:hypothetical protein [Natronorubrum thiooxidans]SIS18043.1 hypothetical protein SAMN05421752_1196 [Natronorubrum thiooxidans]
MGVQACLDRCLGFLESLEDGLEMRNALVFSGEVGLEGPDVLTERLKFVGECLIRDRNS